MGSTWDLNIWQRVLRLTAQDSHEIGADQLRDLWRETVLVGVRELRQRPLPAAAAAGLSRLVGPPCTNLVRACQALAERRRPAAALLGGSRSPPAGQFEAILDEAEGDVAQADERPAQPAGSPRRPYERFLAQSDGGRRRKHGVYYTPAELARHLVQRLDAALRDHFGLAHGLADDADWARFHERTGVAPPAGIPPQTPFAMLLDPAAGDGQFLVEVIDRIHVSLVAAWRDEGADERQIARRWNDYVPRHLLPRLCGLELMLPALVLAHLRIAGKLAETGFDFRRAKPLRLALASTLAGPPAPLKELQGLPRSARIAVRTAWQLRFEQPFPLVLGNPPFASLSASGGRWIADLLRGHDGQCPRASYYLSGGQPLGERKHWLHDDYVKFLRYAHWQVERCGCGVVALVANHGFLDNATFRGLRERLWEDFSSFEILDLHGNRKKRELAPDGQRDQNVFGIDSGVATIVLARPPAPTTSQRTYRELWGTRAKKLQALAGGLGELGTPRVLSPAGPQFLLVPRPTRVDPWYDSGPLLTEAFPVHTTAPVTARDGLVVAFERQELVDRMNQLRDLTVPDDEIRRLYFRRRRSWRYPSGDTRGWQLAAARRRLASLADWESWIRPCLYRPFDYRYVFWVPWMIDWPRQPVVQPWLEAGGPALIARRQMLPHRPCTYFWICDHLALDGVIRSDNRGSESLLPLYLAAADSPGPGRVRRANLSAALIDELRQRTGLAWRSAGAGDGRRTFGPDDVLHYVYALFHWPTYRVRFAESLRTNFPRLLWPAGGQMFTALAALGRQLADCHLLRPGAAFDGTPRVECPDVPVVIRRQAIRYERGRIWCATNASWGPVAENVWQFQVGGYQPCRKWLADRAGRLLTAEAAEHYGRMLASIRATIDLQAGIERQWAGENRGWG